MLRQRIPSDKSLGIAPALALAAVLIALWTFSAGGEWTRLGLIPSPTSVALALKTEVERGRLAGDVVVSLFRMVCGFALATLAGVPLGLLLGISLRAREAVLPFVNFFRGLSPLAWLPFAVLWLGLGDRPAIFIIFLGTVFPLCVSSMAAAMRVPDTYFRVAAESGFGRAAMFGRVVLPWALPDIVAAMRVGAGVAWMVLVPAEMLSGRDGLGFAIMDARNGMRMDLLVGYMIVIGSIGIGIDRLLLILTQLPGLRWGHGRR